MLVACSTKQLPAPERVPVAIVPAVANKDVDVLFLIDDTVSLDTETALSNSFPSLVTVLAEGGLPNLHIGVATSDPEVGQMETRTYVCSE